MVVRTTNEELKKQLEAIQDKEFAKNRTYTNAELKRKLEAEQDEILTNQRLHSSNSLDVSESKKIELIPIREVEDLAIGFHGKINPCSELVKLYKDK